MSTVAFRRPESVNGANGDPLDHTTEQERAVLMMVRKYLTHARVGKMTGTLKFTIDMRNGGIGNKRAITEVAE